MSSFLLEILCEELPFHAQKYAKDNLNDAFIKNVLAPIKLERSSLKVLTTPRRISVLIEGIFYQQNSTPQQKKGPSVKMPAEVLEKFLLANNKTKEDLYIKVVNHKEYYFIKLDCMQSVGIENFLQDSVEKILQNFSCPNPMRWGNYKIEWARPIKSIACMLDDKIIPIVFHHYQSCNTTFAHRCITKNASFIINQASFYQDLLRKNFVILDKEERKDIIRTQISNIEKEHCIKAKVANNLLEEVAGIVEWPHCIAGNFDEAFLEMPSQLIINVIEKHQKIFPVFKEGKITNKFIVVADFRDDSVISGYQRVISARLHDAKSMLFHDKKFKLKDYTKKLKDITFYGKLGDFDQKTQRIASLAKFISVWVPNASITKVEQAAMLCKADLATSVVRDFPEMAGFMGAYYLAQEQEECDPEILTAIRNHNMPIDAQDKCPVEPVSIAISLADKIDNTVGFFVVSEKINSTKDPLGIRRNTVGALRVILQNNINLAVSVAVIKSINLYPNSFFCGFAEKIGIKPEDQRHQKGQLIDQILSFIQERLRGILRSEGISNVVFKACIKDIDHPVLFRARCIILENFIKTQDGQDFLTSIKRVYRILDKNKEFVCKVKPKYSKKLFIKEQEQEFADFLESVSEKIDAKLKDNKFEDALNLLPDVGRRVSHFMNTTLINCDDEDIKKNRFGLLLLFQLMIEKVLEFKSFFNE